MKDEPKYTRTGPAIRKEETRKRTVYKSINAAKRASRKLQMAEDGALGLGTVRLT